MLAVVARAKDFSLEMIDSRKLSGFSTAGGLQQVHNVRLFLLKFSILTGQCHEIFHDSVSPKPLSSEYTIRVISIFSKIRSSRCTTGGIDSGDKSKKSLIRKFLLF
jgi:hypothetical protein